MSSKLNQSVLFHEAKAVSTTICLHTCVTSAFTQSFSVRILWLCFANFSDSFIPTSSLPLEKCQRGESGTCEKGINLNNETNTLRRKSQKVWPYIFVFQLQKTFSVIDRTLRSDLFPRFLHRCSRCISTTNSATKQIGLSRYIFFMGALTIY